VAGRVNRFDAAEYLAQLRRYGRARLPAGTRKSMLPLLAAVTGAESDGGWTAGDSAVLELAQAVAGCETSMLIEPRPTYTVYVNIRVLDPRRNQGPGGAGRQIA
jgi:hypothetical protein